MTRRALDRESWAYTEVKLKNLLRGRASQKQDTTTSREKLEEAIQFLRESLSATALRGLFEWMRIEPHVRRVALRTLPKRAWRELGRPEPHEPVPLERELLWTVLTLNVRARQLRAFHGLSDEFAAHAATDAYDEALQTLDKIDLVFGVSTWSLENRLAVTQLKGGNDATQGVAKSIQSKAPNSLAAFLAHHYTRRNDSNASLPRFVSRFRDLFRKREFPEDLSDYLTFKLTEELPSASDRLAGVLRHEQSASIIDLHETFTVITKTLASSDVRADAELAIVALALYEPSDQRNNALKYVLGIAPNDHRQETQACTASASFWRNETANAVDLSLKAFRADSADAQLLILASEAKALSLNEQSEDKSLSSRLSTLAANVIARTPEADRSFQELNRTCFNLRWIPSIRVLHAHCELYRPHDSLAQSGIHTEIFTNAGRRSPALAASLPGKLAPSFLAQFSERHRADLTAASIRLGLPVTPDHTDFNPERLLEIQAIGDLAAGRFQSALQNARQLRTSTNHALSLRGALLELETHNEQENMSASIRLVTELALRHPSVRDTLPIARIFENREFSDFAELHADPCFPIACEVWHSQRDNADTRNLMRWACDEFLHQHDTKKPSQIPRPATFISTDQYNYFLARVCTMPALHACRHLDSSRAVEEERIEICAILAGATQDHAQYREELTELTGRRLLNDGVRTVDKSRIFIDKRGLTAVIERDYRDSYEQYRNQLSKDSKDDTLFTEALKALVSDNKAPAEQYLRLPKDDAGTILIELTESMRREVLTNTEHGLDKYLSMRIRHGTLSGTLRGPLEERQIITTKRAGSTSYKPNTHWAQKVRSELGDDQATKVGELLASLSEKYDDLIENKLRPLIQVEKPPNNAGLKASLPELMLRILRREAELTPDFAAFIATCLHAFQGALHQELSTLKTQIRDTFTPELESMFQAAEHSLAELPQSNSITSLRRDLVLARTEATNALDKICDWLQITRADSIDRTYSAQQVAQVAVESTRRTLKGFKFKEKIHAEPTPQLGATVLQAVSDILFVALDNVFKHSQLPSPEVSINIQHADNTLTINTESDCVPSAVEAPAIGRIRDTLNNDSYRVLANTEGNSGLFKIKTIVSKHREGQLKFGFNDKRRFFVQTTLKLINFSTTGHSEVLDE